MTAAAAGVEFPGVRVEDPASPGEIEVSAFRVNGTAAVRNRGTGRQRCGSEHIHPGPLRYRRRRGAARSLAAASGKDPRGLGPPGLLPRPQEGAVPARGRRYGENCSFSCFVDYGPIPPFVKTGSLDRPQKMKILRPEPAVLQLDAPCRISVPTPAHLILRLMARGWLSG